MTGSFGIAKHCHCVGFNHLLHQSKLPSIWCAIAMQVYGADEAFVTGTFAGLLPVVEVDGRVIGSGGRGQLTEQLQKLYQALVEADVAGGRQACWEDE